MKRTLFPSLFALASAVVLSADAQELKPAAPPGPESAQGDNADVLAGEAISKAIKTDDSLSASAKAIKVVVSNNVITLHGTVTSQSERSTVESIARRALGDRLKLDSQLTLATNQ